MSHNQFWSTSKHKPRFAGPPAPEPETDGELFVEQRHTRQVRAFLYETGRKMGYRGRQLTQYVEHELHVRELQAS